MWLWAAPLFSRAGVSNAWLILVLEPAARAAVIGALLDALPAEHAHLWARRKRREGGVGGRRRETVSTCDRGPAEQLWKIAEGPAGHLPALWQG